LLTSRFDHAAADRKLLLLHRKVIHVAFLIFQVTDRFIETHIKTKALRFQFPDNRYPARSYFRFGVVATRWILPESSGQTELAFAEASRLR